MNGHTNAFELKEKASVVNGTVGDSGLGPIGSEKGEFIIITYLCNITGFHDS